jgi:hypothetical protein
MLLPNPFFLLQIGEQLDEFADLSVHNYVFAAIFFSFGRKLGRYRRIPARKAD